MVSYQPVLHPTAERELNSLDEHDKDRLVDVLHEVAHTRQPTQHEKCKILEGHQGLFRVRVGDVRAILTLEKPNLKVLRVGKRSNVYDIIDDIDQRRATA